MLPTRKALYERIEQLEAELAAAKSKPKAAPPAGKTTPPARSSSRLKSAAEAGEPRNEAEFWAAYERIEAPVQRTLFWRRNAARLGLSLNTRLPRTR